MAKYLDLDGLTRYNSKVNAKLDKKANVDGAYELMTVGNAEQLIASTTVEDKSPYLFRTSGGSLDIGDRLNLKSIVGGSVVWNQLVQNGNFADTSNWEVVYGNMSIANNKCTFTAVAGTIGNGSRIRQNCNIVSGHTYLCMADITSVKNSQILLYVGTDPQTFTVTANVKTRVAIISKATADKTVYEIYVNRNSLLVDGDTVIIENANIFDLTAMFGSTIADYIYSLEQATAGSGVAYFRSLFPKDYYAYNAGQLMSVKALSHKMVGFNACDEIWELGAIDGNGNAISSTTSIRLKNKIKVVPNTTYYMSRKDGKRFLYFFTYKKDGTLSRYNGLINAETYNFAIREDEYYLWCYQYSNTTAPSDFCVHLKWDGERDGEYEAYEEHIYPLDSDLELRGIPKLDANNQLYYDGDTYESDGTVTRKYAVVDLGSLNWVYQQAQQRFITDNPFTSAKGAATDVTANILCEKYISVAYGDTSKSYYNKSIGIFTTPYIAIRDESYTDKDTFKTAMSGVYLVYELATPTTETADTFTNPQLVDNWGTEEFVDNRDVPIPVGHLTDYYPDLRAKLEMTPNSPDRNGDYLVRQTNGINEYVEYVSPIPAVPSEDGTYTFKATRSGSTITYNWVAE